MSAPKKIEKKGKAEPKEAKDKEEPAFDVIVVGGGAIGLAASYYVAKEKKSTLVLEQFQLYNKQGSSNDYVRMFRTMYTEEYNMQFALESYKLWKELEKEAKRTLIEMTGLLNFGNPEYKSGPEGNLKDPIPLMKKHGLKFEEFNSGAEITKRFPFLQNLPETYEGVFAELNGCINVPGVLETLAELAISHGAKINEMEKVLTISFKDEVVIVETNKATYRSKHVILAPGAYANNVLKTLGFQLNINIWDMVYEYYSLPAKKAASKQPMWFQFEFDGVNDNKSNLFYGFPAVPWGPAYSTRIAVDYASHIMTNPNERKLRASGYELAITQKWVKEHISGAEEQIPWFQGTCLQTNLPDNDYLLDFAPEKYLGENHKKVSIFCAGWAFKNIPVIGKVLADLSLRGETQQDISHYSINRKGVIKEEHQIHKVRAHK